MKMDNFLKFKHSKTKHNLLRNCNKLNSRITTFHKHSESVTGHVCSVDMTEINQAA